MSDSTKKIWFITGSSSGFGRAMLERVLQNGDIAIATLRNPAVLEPLAEKYPSSQLLLVQLDVSNPDDISAAFDAARMAFGRIDVVFNNAAFAIIGEAEASPDAIARKLFEVDFWGAANVSRAAVAFLRDVNTPQGGRLLQISSMSGVQGYAAMSYYSAAKFALEGFSESLAAELDPEWNIKITLIEPGGFRTDALSRSVEIVDPHPAYTRPGLQSVAVRSMMRSDAKLPGDTNKATALFCRLVALPDPPLHLPLGLDSVGGARNKIESLLRDVEKYAPWSEDLTHDDA